MGATGALSALTFKAASAVRLAMKNTKKRPLLSRRSFLGALPAVSATAFAQAAAQDARPSELDKDGVNAAQKVVGNEFRNADPDAVLREANGNLTSYRALRAVEIPTDTEPAFIFRPYLPGRQPLGPATPNARLKLARRLSPSPWKSHEDLAFLPVTELASLLKTRKVSATDLTKMYLSRLNRYGERLSCVVTLTEDLALAQAAEADREIRSGRYRGPLHGIPWGAKDILATKGIRTTWGASPFEKQVFDFDATVVERLREAGAVLVAKLSLGPLAGPGGTVKNPWDPATTLAGSSSGPAAATAAGLVGFAIGSESDGSIIGPAQACGVTGLRPTYGRVSRYGAMALSWTMDKLGPLCRSAEDGALVLNAIYGPDGRDGSVVDAAFKWNPDLPLSKLRVGFVKSQFDHEPPPGTSDDQKRDWVARKEIMAQALAALRNVGLRLEPMELPDFPAGNGTGDPNDLHWAQVLAMLLVSEAEQASALDEPTRSGVIDQLRAQGSALPNLLRARQLIPAVEYLRAQRIRTLIMRNMDRLFSTYAAFVEPGFQFDSLTIANLTGHPAVALNAGFVRGLPEGIAITGRLYDEGTLLRIAMAYERGTTWRTVHPRL